MASEGPVRGLGEGRGGRGSTSQQQGPVGKDVWESVGVGVCGEEYVEWVGREPHRISHNIFPHAQNPSRVSLRPACDGTLKQVPQ